MTWDELDLDAVEVQPAHRLGRELGARRDGDEDDAVGHVDRHVLVAEGVADPGAASASASRRSDGEKRTRSACSGVRSTTRIRSPSSWSTAPSCRYEPRGRSIATSAPAALLSRETPLGRVGLGHRDGIAAASGVARLVGLPQQRGDDEHHFRLGGSGAPSRA